MPRRSLSRRNVLKAAGAAVALPYLVPAGILQAAAERDGPRRHHRAGRPGELDRQRIARRDRT